MISTLEAVPLGVHMGVKKYVFNKQRWIL